VRTTMASKVGEQWAVKSDMGKPPMVDLGINHGAF
jgi:hypothetical protein